VVREIRWTSESEAHIARHGVCRRRSSRPSTVGLGTRPVAVRTPPSCTAATEDGRALLVVLAEAVDGRWYVATARDMTDTERRAFRRKGR
jgi:uncharacterized protein